MKARTRRRHGSGKTKGVVDLEKTRKVRRQYKDTARVFKKINEKLDPNSRNKISRYVKGSKGESNSVLDYSGFQQMMKSCRLDDRLSGDDVRTMFDYLRGKNDRVEFSEFRKALDQEWISQTNQDVSVSIPKSNDLKRNLIRTARNMMFGKHEGNEEVVRKLYRNIVGDLRGEIPISEFARSVRKFGFNEKEADDLCTACDEDCDGFVSLTDFTTSMLSSEAQDEGGNGGFMISSRQRSLHRLKARLERAQVGLSTRDTDSVVSSSTQKSWHDMRRPDVCIFTYLLETLFFPSQPTNQTHTHTQIQTKRLFQKAATSLSSLKEPLNSTSTRPENHAWSKNLHHRPIDWMPKKVQQMSPTARARNYFTENGYNASTMRMASKIQQQERYEKGLREIREHEEKKRIKSEIGRVVSSARAKYEFEKRAQERQEGSLRRQALNGKRQLPATRLRCFEGNIPFLNPNLERMLSSRVMESSRRNERK